MTSAREHHRALTSVQDHHCTPTSARDHHRAPTSARDHHHALTAAIVNSGFDPDTFYRGGHTKLLTDSPDDENLHNHTASSQDSTDTDSPLESPGSPAEGAMSMSTPTEGNVNAHTERNINAHTERNINAHTERNINAHTERNINAHTERNINTPTERNIDVHAWPRAEPATPTGRPRPQNQQRPSSYPNTDVITGQKKWQPRGTAQARGTQVTSLFAPPARTDVMAGQETRQPRGTTQAQSTQVTSLFAPPASTDFIAGQETRWPWGTTQVPPASMPVSINKSSKMEVKSQRRWTLYVEHLRSSETKCLISLWSEDEILKKLESSRNKMAYVKIIQAKVIQSMKKIKYAPIISFNNSPAKADARQKVYLAGVRALRIIDKTITGPFFRLLGVEKIVLDMNVYLHQMQLCLERQHMLGQRATTNDITACDAIGMANIRRNSGPTASTAKKVALKQ
ncbi:Hypp6193 [Branchiostoma lanceolatum]|uniref:Hypp6193 protein n=1 Tax=Branchiostoma lanceolatum TaxID=7740 RepID=A0A8J9YQ47_BRALA|nr:Hypp6193 [Branchiostoma lanceolatum]